MVKDTFFEHTTPEGVTMVDRILRAKYVREDEGWALGENLAWGTGSYGTPRGAVEAWMDSPGHRANILKRSFRDMGVGIVLGVPVSDAAGTTYTVDFGVARTGASLAATWPTSNPSAPSTTTATASAASSPSSPRPTT